MGLWDLFGPSSAPTPENVVNAVSEMISETTLKTQSRCITQTQASQIIDISISVSPDVAKARLQACENCLNRMTLFSSRSHCDRLCQDSELDLSNVRQTTVLQVTSGCRFEEDYATQVRNNLDQALAASTSKKNDVVGEFLSILQSNGKSGSHTDMQNRIKNAVTQESLNEMMTAIDNKQELKLSLKNASGHVNALTQETTVTLMAQALRKTKAFQDLTEAIHQTSTSTVSKETTGPMDALQTLIRQAGSTANTYLIVMAVVIVVMFIVGGIICYKYGDKILSLFTFDLAGNDDNDDGDEVKDATK